MTSLKLLLLLALVTTVVLARHGHEDREAHRARKLENEVGAVDPEPRWTTQKMTIHRCMLGKTFQCAIEDFCLPDDWRCVAVGTRCSYGAGWCWPLARPPEVPPQPEPEPKHLTRDARNATDRGSHHALKTTYTLVHDGGFRADKKWKPLTITVKRCATSGDCGAWEYCLYDDWRCIVGSCAFQMGWCMPHELPDKYPH